MPNPLRMTEAQLRAYYTKRGEKPPKPVLEPKKTPDIIRTSKTVEERLNKTEKRFLLYARAQWGEVGIQRYTFRLANDCRYTPDFDTVIDGKLRLWEVKGGFHRDDAIVKIKVAASTFPIHDFWFARLIKGEWILREVPA